MCIGGTDTPYGKIICQDLGVSSHKEILAHTHWCLLPKLMFFKNTKTLKDWKADEAAEKMALVETGY